MQPQKYDLQMKFVLLGPVRTGKSSLLQGKVEEKYSSTIGVEFQSKVLTLDGKSYKIQGWDTAGE